jgi:hypothetical protein
LLEYELKKLQELTSALDPKNFPDEFSALNSLERNKQVVEEECTRIKDALTKAIFTSAKENIIERYIQYHQTGIIQLADQLQSYLSIEGPDSKDPFSAGIAITKAFISQLFGLLNYIERFFFEVF